MSKNSDLQPFSKELGIISYDIHTYYSQSNEASRAEAAALRDKLATEFSSYVDAGELFIYKLWDRPIGPHPYAMWECDFKTPELYAKLVPWFTVNHGSLSVLIHPRTAKSDLVDHTNHALWLGDRVPLIESVLKN